MNESTTVPPVVSGMQMAGSMQPSDDCNEPMQPLPTATTNVLLSPTTEVSMQTTANAAAVPATGKVLWKYDLLSYSRFIPHFKVCNKFNFLQK